MALNTIFLGIIGGTEVILIIVVVVLLFGGRKIPELMRGIGKGINEFKKGVRGDDETENKDMKG
jgi:sec-independent protein translocase protein TatA